MLENKEWGDAPGIGRLYSEASSLQERLNNAVKNNINEVFIVDEFERGVKKLEELNETIIQQNIEAMQKDEDELKKTLMEKLPQNPAEKLYNLQKFQMEYELLNDDEFDKKIEEVGGGQELFLNTDQATAFLTAVKQRKPKLFDIVKKNMKIYNSFEPWKNLQTREVKTYHAGLAARQQGEFITVRQSDKHYNDKNQKSISYFRRSVRELISLPNVPALQRQLITQRERDREGIIKQKFDSALAKLGH